MPREDLAKRFWDDKAQKIYDETYEKIYRKHNDIDLAINLAEDATDEYLVKQSKKGFGENTQKFFDDLFPYTN